MLGPRYNSVNFRRGGDGRWWLKAVHDQLEELMLWLCFLPMSGGYCLLPTLLMYIYRCTLNLYHYFYLDMEEGEVGEVGVAALERLAHLSIDLCMYLSIYLSIYLSTYLSIFLSKYIYLSSYLSNNQWFYPSI